MPARPLPYFPSNKHDEPHQHCGFCHEPISPSQYLEADQLCNQCFDDRAAQLALDKQDDDEDLQPLTVSPQQLDQLTQNPEFLPTHRADPLRLQQAQDNAPDATILGFWRSQPVILDPDYLSALEELKPFFLTHIV